MPKPTHPPPPKRSWSKRPPPKPPQQELTGPMQFGLSPRGVFISGEDAQNLLEKLLKENPSLLTEINENNSALRELAKILAWANKSSEKRVQSMRSYFECFKGLDVK